LAGGAPTFTAVTGTPAVSVNGLASDGFNVYIAVGASGIYLTNTGTGAASSHITGTVGGFVSYTKGRLLCSNANSVYNPTGAGALPTALLTHDNTGFTWVGAAAGLRHIFLAGYAGDKSLIYRTEVKNDGSALDVPQVASELPDGEVIHSIEGYLGNYVFLGTSKGVRFATCDTDGNLNIGSVIPTTNPVKCFEPQDKYVWFGYTNYDATSTGLGRMDLTQFTESAETEARVPAYASDLMVTGQGTVVSCVTFENIRFFSVAADGFYAQHATNKVATATIETGLIGFGLPDQKAAMFADVRTQALAGDYSVELDIDGTGYNGIGTENAAGDLGTEFPCNQDQGERFELRFTLNRAAGTTTGPTVTRYTLKASPGNTSGPAEYIIVPLLVHRTMSPRNKEEYIDVQARVESVKELRESHRAVIYQEASISYNVFVDAYEWLPIEFTEGEHGEYGFPDGTILVQLKRVFS
jgi:hypothetical protein